MAAVLALAWAASACGGLAADADPLASMAQAVREDRRYPAPLSESWRRAPADPLTLRPAVSATNVYLAIGNRLVAWRVSNGETAWGPFELESDVSAAPTAVGQQVVIATRGNDTTGPRVWWFSNDGSLDSQAPVAAPISEISAATGTVIYIDDRGVGRLGDSNDWHTALDNATTVDLAAEHGLALVTTASGGLLALDVRDGELRWQHDAESAISRAHVSGDRAYVGTTDGDVIAFEIADGRIDWRRRLGTSVVGSPGRAEDLLWVAGLDARLNAVNAGNGTQMYSVELSSRNYLDIATFGQWAVIGAHYGPWLAVRAPTRDEQGQGNPRRPTPPVRVEVQEPPATNRPDLTIPAGSGPAGVAVVTSDGTVVFLQPQRAR